jgi:hypothetical protein
MALDEMVRGLALAVRCALTVEQDAPLAAGATH